MEDQKPWTQSMPEAQFELMRDILAAPSPVGLEAAMTQGVLKPYFEKIAPEGWGIHEFVGNAGIVLDSHPGCDDMFTVMMIGHADKIRLQVRSIGDDGKIWVNSDSFLPNVLLGHEVLLFSQKPDEPGSWQVIEGGTIEALGAIHFADAETRTGKKGITSKMLYLELQIHGEDRKKQVEQLGIQSGDTLILNRKIKRGFSPDTFYGAYLDNGLGCFVAAETARLIAERGGLEHVRVLYTIASHEEIGRMGSRVAAGTFKPDVVIALDVSHDYEAAPGISDRRMTPQRMGAGMTLATGAIVSEQLNTMIERASQANDVPFQRSIVGRDTGTDGMAGFLAAVDAASTSIGFPIRNMHTISETGHTGDVLCAVWSMVHTLEAMDRDKVSTETFKKNHARLDKSTPISWRPVEKDEDNA